MPTQREFAVLMYSNALHKSLTSRQRLDCSARDNTQHLTHVLVNCQAFSKCSDSRALVELRLLQPEPRKHEPGISKSGTANRRRYSSAQPTPANLSESAAVGDPKERDCPTGIV